LAPRLAGRIDRRQPLVEHLDLLGAAEPGQAPDPLRQQPPVVGRQPQAEVGLDQRLREPGELPEGGSRHFQGSSTALLSL